MLLLSSSLRSRFVVVNSLVNPKPFNSEGSSKKISSILIILGTPSFFAFLILPSWYFHYSGTECVTECSVIFFFPTYSTSVITPESRTQGQTTHLQLSTSTHAFWPWPSFRSIVPSSMLPFWILLFQSHTTTNQKYFYLQLRNDHDEDGDDKENQ